VGVARRSARHLTRRSRTTTPAAIHRKAFHYIREPFPGQARVDQTESAAPIAVIDTNVVLDWLVFDDPRARPLAEAVAAGRLRWVATAAMLDELAAVLPRPAFDRWRDRAALAPGRAAGWAVPAGDAPACALRCGDADDQKYIDLTLAARAAWLLTRDKALLKLAAAARRHGTTVCVPERFAG
jgi:predicted nucleic acid-binding protein